jgi:putative ABC transport system permease protein
MNNTHFRKIVGDIASRKVRTLLVASSIFIGVMGVIALLTMRDLIITQLESDVQLDELAMIEVDVTLSSSAAVDNIAILELLNQAPDTPRLPALEGIERVEALGLYNVDYRHPDSDTPRGGQIRAYPGALQDAQIEPMRLVEGEWPVAGQNELALETRLADAAGFAVGDEIVLTPGSVERTFTVSGLVFHPYSYKRPSSDGSITPGPEDGIYMLFADLENAFGRDAYTRFLVRYETFALAEAHFEGFQSVIREETAYLPKFPILEDPQDNGQIFNVETFGNVLSLLAVIAMVVSGFLVVNVVNTIVVEQKRQIGVMKSLGATRTDNVLMYGGIAFGYGLIGTLLAIIPGIIVGYAAAQSLAPQLDVLIEGFAWSPESVLVGVLLGLSVPVGAALIPVWMGTRVTILEAVTDLGIDANYGEGPVAQGIRRLSLPIVFKQALSNVVQKKGRLLLTGLTLMSAIGASMGIIANGRSLNQSVNDIFDRLDYEITVLPVDIQQIDETRAVLTGLNNVESVSSGVIVTVQVQADYSNFATRNNQVVSFGNDPAEAPYIFALNEGSGWANDPQRDGVVIAAPMANQIGLGVGDEIEFVVSGQTIRREIIGIESTAFDAIWARWDDLAQVGGFSTDGPQPNTYSVPVSVAEVGGFAGAVGIGGNGAAVLYGQALPSDAVLITEALATAGDVAVGDDVVVTVQGEPVTRTVAGIVAQQDFEALLAQQGGQALSVQNIVFFDFSDLIALTGAALGQTPSPNAFYVEITASDADVETVDAAIDEIDTALNNAGINAETQNQIERFTDVTNLISQYTAILTLAAILITAVGAVGLLTTLTITVFERQKEIGVMRSVGAGSYTIATQFLIEGLIIGTVAWVGGIPISYLLAVQIQAAFQLDTVDFNYPIEVLFLGLAGMVLITTVASLGPSLGAARRTVSNILRYQ